MSDILYKVYTGETVIRRTLAISTNYNLVFVHAWLPLARAYVQKCLRTQDPLHTVYVQREPRSRMTGPFSGAGRYH